MNNTNIISLAEARMSLENQKAIFVITNEDVDANKYGYLAYISNDDSTYKNMMKEFRKLKREQKRATVIGSYENGGAIGVQYIVQ